MDFSQGEDVLDVFQVDAIAATASDENFDFIGTAAFTAAGQLRYAKVAAGNRTVVSMNTDADTDPEGVFVLAGRLVDLSETDLIL